MKLDQVCGFLNRFAPLGLAEDWDNVGLLVGDRDREIERVMTCLTITPASVAEAVDRGAGLIVTHHPLPFRPLKRPTADSVSGRMLLALIGAGVAVYSPHTAFDSAAAGINQRLAEGLGLTDIAPLVPRDSPPRELEGLGAGRYGRLSAELPLDELARRLATWLRLESVRTVGSPAQRASKVAVACGSGGEFLAAARRQGCDALITGETNFHTCLQAEAEGVGLLLSGHYASERFAVEQLADLLAAEFPQLDVWASQREADPLRTIRV